MDGLLIEELTMYFALCGCHVKCIGKGLIWTVGFVCITGFNK